MHWVPFFPTVSAIQLIKVAITSDCSPTWTHSAFFFQFPGHSPQTTSFISSWIACHRQINRPLTSIHKPSAPSRLVTCPLPQYHQASIGEAEKTPNRLETSIRSLFYGPQCHQDWKFSAPFPLQSCNSHSMPLLMHIPPLNVPCQFLCLSLLIYKMGNHQSTHLEN